MSIERTTLRSVSTRDRVPETSDLHAVLDSLDAQRIAERTTMTTSADRAARRLRAQVVDGRLRSGTRLPEERLAAALGVSRNTLREALTMLVAERILVREPHRGVLVATPSADDVRDVYALRLIVEPAALEHGPALTDSARTALADAVAAGRAAHDRGDVDGVADANQHFHRAVVALADSRRLDDQMDLLLAEMRLFFHQMDDRGFHSPYLAENEAILALLEAGDRAGAADRVRDYLVRARDQLLDGFAARV